MKERAFYYFFSFSALLLILSSEQFGGGPNITFPVSVLMKYILLSNNFLKKLMELFNIQNNTFLFFLWHIFNGVHSNDNFFNIVLPSTSALYK